MIASMLLIPLVAGTKAQEPSLPSEPWVVVDQPSPKPYDSLGRPGIVLLEDGSIVLSVEHIGHYATHIGTYVYRSTDRGRSWTQVAELDRPSQTSLFARAGELYLLGVDGSGRSLLGRPVIRRSTDGGKTWSDPRDATTGLLRGEYVLQTRGRAALIHDNRVWRLFARSFFSLGKSLNWHLVLASASLESDPLKEENWRWSDELCLEGLKGTVWTNSILILTHEAGLVLLGRSYSDEVRFAATVTPDGRSLRRRSEEPAWNLPERAAGERFVRDAASGRFHVLTLRGKPVEERTWGSEVAVESSGDLVTWESGSVLLRENRAEGVLFASSADWVADGDDLLVAFVAVVPREPTPDDARRSARSLLFLRVPGFRQRTLETPPLWEGRE